MYMYHIHRVIALKNNLQNDVYQYPDDHYIGVSLFQPNKRTSITKAHKNPCNNYQYDSVCNKNYDFALL